MRELVTYQDAIEATLEAFDLSGTEREFRLARGAVTEAMRGITGCSTWSWYNRTKLLILPASYDTGTVVYDHCVSMDHEALTRNGWKTRDQLEIGEEILAYDHASETCSWQPIERIHDFDYDGDMLEVTRKGRTVFRCTPNHRIPVWKRQGKNRTLAKSFVRASELTEEHLAPLSAPLNQEECGFISPRLAGILAWCVTDGYGLFNRKHFNTAISQSETKNPDKCRELEAIIGRPGSAIKNSQGMLRFPVLSRDRGMLRAMVKDKQDLVRAVCGMGVHQAQAVVKAMNLAESSTNPSGQKVFSQWGANKPVAEAFQIACLITGVAANISEGDFHCTSFGKDYGIRRRYQVPVRSRNKIKLKRQSKWVPYKGKVWCPQVRTSAWVMRCNGAVMITGNSGGAHERMLTLTTGTWPTWSAQGTVTIAEIPYEVEQYVSSSIIILGENSNPGADVASTTYRIDQFEYDLPDDFHAVQEAYDLTNHRTFPLSPGIPLSNYSSLIGRTPGTPSFGTFFGSGQFTKMRLQVTPPPSVDTTLNIAYLALPRELRTEAERTGTVSCTANSQTITGVGTAFSAQHVGAVLRLSSDGVQFPTNSIGHRSTQKTNRRVYEGKIIRVASTTSLTVEEAPTASLSTVKFTISDPLDVAQDAMTTAVFRWAERVMAERLNQLPAAIDRKRSAEITALRQALEADGRMRESSLMPVGSADIAYTSS